MIWRHILLGLAEMEAVPSYVLDRVGRLARGLGAEVELFHCIYDPELARVAPSQAAIAERIRERVEERHRHLERVADILRNQSVDARASVRWDRPIYEAMIREVLRSGAELAVVPAGRLGHAGPVTLTYTDARLIETCPCPLLLLKTEQVYREGPIVAAVDPGHAHAKTAELDDTIVDAAKTLAYALAETPVHLYHAVPALAEPPVHWVGREHEARKLAVRHDLPEGRVFVEVGAVESALPAYAREAHASAVVMGAVSRAYPARAQFGYTAEKVLDALDCDVLIVKPEGFRTPVPRRAPRVENPKVARAVSEASQPVAISPPA